MMVENSVYGIRGFNSHCKQRKRAIASCCDCVAATYLHQSGPLVVFDVAEVSSARELDVFGKPLQNTTNTGTPRERVSAQKSLCLNIVIEVVYIYSGGKPGYRCMVFVMCQTCLMVH